MPPTKARRVRLPASERRQQLIAAAQKVYLELGVDRASVLKVARAAGVNNATLYQHFASSADLFREAVLEPLDQVLEEEIATATERMQGLDSPDLLAEMHHSLTVMMERMGLMLNIILFANNEASRRHYTDTLKPRLEDWINETLAAADQPTTGEWAATAPGILGMYLWLAMHTAYRGNEMQAQSLPTDIADFLSAGLKQTLP